MILITAEILELALQMNEEFRISRLDAARNNFGPST
jgi:hypothetical protein